VSGACQPLANPQPVARRSLLPACGADGRAARTWLSGRAIAAAAEVFLSDGCDGGYSHEAINWTYKKNQTTESK
jgi:hypothetical protein